MNKKEISKKIIIGISGSSGVIYGIKLLNILRELKIESHLIISKATNLTISAETDYSLKDVKCMADYSYSPSDIGARISSGSFITNGMIVAPCSMKTLSAIANGYEDNLIARAASVVMKEQKKLVLMTRETPLHAIHLENMLKLSRAGVVISPPVPAFYNNPTSLNDIIIHSLTRVLDLFDIDTSLIKRWDGII
jgi:4-hydroxy-3-polyprenylbenzoate decarboxylase|tara:strand:- start:847 stop:1428 length:582 start_codon:yes stop_codon:yes gene_type:complete